MNKRLPMALAAKKNMGCKDCMAMGGKCMAHGGEVSEEMNPGHEDAMLPNMDHTESSVEASSMEEDLPKMAESLSLAAEVMKDRKRVHMAKGGMVESDEMDADASPAFDKRMDLEPVHTMADPEHDQESPSLDDESLIGQILKERKMRRRS